MSGLNSMLDLGLHAHSRVLLIHWPLYATTHSPACCAQQLEVQSHHCLQQFSDTLLIEVLLYLQRRHPPHHPSCCGLRHWCVHIQGLAAVL